MRNPDQGSKIAIEDLLRLKRAERPSAEFWPTFERELRQKQLTALLNKRPWWRELPQLITRRAYLPVGATAVLAFTLVSLKYFGPVQVASLLEGGTASPAVAANTPAERQPADQIISPTSSPLVNRESESVARTEDRVNPPTNSASLSTVVTETKVASLSPDQTESPSARSIAANLEHFAQSEPELVNAVLGSRLSSPVRVQPAVAPVVELASLSANGSKRSRLLANYNDRPLSPEPTAPESVRERLSRRLGDADYTERFSRIGLKGSQVSLKF